MLRRFVCRLALPLLMAAPLAAQTNLRNQVAQLFHFSSGCPDPLCLQLIGGDSLHGKHFIPALTAGQNNILGFLSDAIGISVSNVPVSATSSGATFTFQNGVPVQTSVSSGPLIGERSQTLGRGRFLIGANATGEQLNSLRGVPLDGIVFDFTHVRGTNDTLGSPIFENDLFEVRPDFHVSLYVASVFLTYGLFDRVDIGVAVPIARVSVSGSSVGRILPFSFDSLLQPHYFTDPSQPGKKLLSANSPNINASATGIGDVAVRVKVNLKQAQGAGFAILVDARLPTGDENNFLGSGHLAVRGLGIWSAKWGDFSPHGNFGYLNRGGSRQSSEILTTVGFDQLVAPWATLAIDVVGQWQVGGTKLTLPGPVTIQVPVVRVIQPSNIPNISDDLLNGAVGFKFVRGGITFATNTLFPLRKGGLQGDFIWTVGMEHNF